MYKTGDIKVHKKKETKMEEHLVLDEPKNEQMQQWRITFISKVFF